MLNSTKNTAKGARIRVVALIAILVISVATWLICQFAVGNEKLGFPAILLLFTVGFLATGIFYVGYALICKRTLMLVIGTPAFTIGLGFLLGILGVFWWVVLIICFVVLIIGALGTFAFKSPELVVEVNNASDSNHKTYAQRKEEESSMPQEEEKPLPEIKSFKE